MSLTYYTFSFNDSRVLDNAREETRYAYLRIISPKIENTFAFV
jgi:hypothetical protein